VIGLVHPDKLLKKSAVQPGDFLILTKPLGVGVTTTAIKREKADAASITEAKNWMKTLNNNASQIAVDLQLKAATDITGFSLLGHAYEMASSSGVRINIFANEIPFLSQARMYGEAGYFAGGAADNRMHYSQFIQFDKSIDEVTEMLLFDPQTSGGLLIACAKEKIDQFKDLAKQNNQPMWIIGNAEVGSNIHVE
jgi:selenide,water dikinase